jgi:AcrR family transcriptional regulator/DNA-binding MarR family transcriptional regulator
MAAVRTARGHDAAPVDLARIQRARILAAMFDVACERGVAEVTVAHVVARSGVSRRTFYEAFGDCEDCFLAALEQAVSHAAECVLPAYRAESSWRERIRAGLVALLCFLDEEPVVGRVLVAESLAAGPRALACRNRVLAQVMCAIDQGREELNAGVEPPPLSAEGIVGGALAIVHARLTAVPRGGELGGAPLVELAAPLMSMIVLPYLGAAAARRELARPVPAVSVAAHDATPLENPFKAVGMRLTYRTVRVLMAIAQQPQASNRAVGELADIKDQGQVSKLLSRLERAGLVANTGLGPGQGAPNAWSLTDAGERVARSLSPVTESVK